MGQNLITRAEYKTYAGISSPNQDAEIDLLIPRVSQFVKTYCRNSFVDWVDEAKVEVFDGDVATYFPREYPIIRTLSLESSDDYGFSYKELVEFTDWIYSYSANGIQSLRPGGFARKHNGYRLTYNCGYETIPEDLKLGIMDLLTYYRRNDSAIHSARAAGSNNLQIEYITSAGLPSHIRRVLDLYIADFV